VAESLLRAFEELIRKTFVTITAVSVRLALKKIAEITCGIAPNVIYVKALGDPMSRLYAASIPWEYRAEIHAYLTQHLSIAIQNDTLILTAEQAGAVVDVAVKHLQRQATRI
jgi:hypothetical protein